MRIDPRQMSAKRGGGVNVVQGINPVIHMRSVGVDEGVVDSLSPELFLDLLGAKGFGAKAGDPNSDSRARLIFDLNPDSHAYDGKAGGLLGHLQIGRAKAPAQNRNSNLGDDLGRFEHRSHKIEKEIFALNPSLVVTSCQPQLRSQSQ